MRESREVTLQSLTSGKIALSATVSGLLPGSDDILVSLTAVLADITGKLHYFALSHADEPDFHARERHVLVGRDEL